MKEFIKAGLEKLGIRLNFVKNLRYLDSFHLVKMLCKNPSPLIFDVGACDGSSIVDFKKIFPDSSINSFEPYPSSYQNLEHVARSFSNVKAYQVAFSNINGQMDFYVNKSKATNSLLPAEITSSFIDEHAVPEGHISVPAMKLDNFVAEHGVDEIDILKIDVQGGELMVLEGSAETLKRKKIKIIYTEIWFIEGYKGQPLYNDVASFLAPFGYLPFGIYNMHYRNDGHFLWGDAIFYLK